MATATVQPKAEGDAAAAPMMAGDDAQSTFSDDTHDSTRSKPHKLVVTQQPPEQWYNQARGRQDTITIKARLVGAADHPALYHMDRLPLSLTLLYENYTEVAQQNILQAMATPELDCTTREVSVVVRINQVSRSHQKQRFRVRLALAELPTGCPPITVICATTTPVRVLSKLSTRNRNRALAASQANGKNLSNTSAAALARAMLPQKRRPGTVNLEDFAKAPTVVDFNRMDANELRNWARRASTVMQALEWWAVGYETVVNQHGDIIIDRTRPILQCHVCGAVHCGDEAGTATHEHGCVLAALTHGLFTNETNPALQRFPRLGRSSSVVPHKPTPAAQQQQQQRQQADAQSGAPTLTRHGTAGSTLSFPDGTAAYAGPGGAALSHADGMLTRSDTAMTLDSQGVPVLTRGSSLGPPLSGGGAAPPAQPPPPVAPALAPNAWQPPQPASSVAPPPGSSQPLDASVVGTLSQFSDIAASQTSLPGLSGADAAGQKRPRPSDGASSGGAAAATTSTSAATTAAAVAAALRPLNGGGVAGTGASTVSGVTTAAGAAAGAAVATEEAKRAPRRRTTKRARHA